MKKRINESQLRAIVAESVRKVLKEANPHLMSKDPLDYEEGAGKPTSLDVGWKHL